MNKKNILYVSNQQCWKVGEIKLIQDSLEEYFWNTVKKNTNTYYVHIYKFLTNSL